MNATEPVDAQSWMKANGDFLRLKLERLRLLVHRRILWLRKSQWKDDPLQNYQGLVISDAQIDFLVAAGHLEAESRFDREDPEAAPITLAIEALENGMAAKTHSAIESVTPPALSVLAHQFTLTSFEQDVLVLCLAPELDPAFERLYAYVQDDVNRKYPTPQLALALFASGSEARLAASQRFLPGAPLRRFHLLTIEPGAQTAATRSVCPLHLDDRIADYLIGFNRCSERIARLLEPMPPALLSPAHVETINQLHKNFEASVRKRLWQAVNLVGSAGSGKRAVARGLCDRLGMPLYRLNLPRLPAPGSEREDTLHLLEREAVMLGFVLYLDASAAEATEKPALIDIVEHLNAHILIGSSERMHTQRQMIGLHLPRPNAEAQRALWQQGLACVPHTLNGELSALTQQFTFGPAAVAGAVAAAQNLARLRDDSAALTAQDLWRACREQASSQLDDLAQRIVPCHTWEDIVLPEDEHLQLREIAAQVAHRPQVYEEWGFGAKLNRGRGISALFAGPSGTGKTLAAEILARRLQLDLYRIDLAGVVNKYIGETEKNLRRVFDAAEQSGAILFFDEADALFGKRSEVRDSHDRYANIEINYLLQRMEDYRGLVILATNMKSLLDQAFLRRLRFVVDFPFPDAAHRLLIWQKAFPPQTSMDAVDFAALSRLEITGGNIKNIALNAAFLAADDSGPIRMKHLLHAARREYAKIGKLMSDGELKPRENRPTVRRNR